MVQIYEVPPHVYAMEARDRSKEILKALKAGYGEPLHPEHVTKAVLEHRARVFAITDDDKELLLLVMQPNESYLHVWVGYGEVTDATLEATITIAKRLGFKGLTFDSRRKGWQRKAMKLGFKPQRWIKEF